MEEADIIIEIDPEIVIANEIFGILLTNGRISRNEIKQILDKTPENNYWKPIVYLSLTPTRTSSKLDSPLNSS